MGEARLTGRETVRTVCRHESRPGEPSSTGFDRHTVPCLLDERHLGAVLELGAGLRRLLGEERVETASLCHQDQRLGALAQVGGAVTEPELHRVHDVLDHGLRREGQLIDGPERQTAATRLVPWKPCLVEQKHRRPFRREPKRSDGAGRPCTDDDRIERGHASIMTGSRAS